MTKQMLAAPAILDNRSLRFVIRHSNFVIHSLLEISFFVILLSITPGCDITPTVLLKPNPSSPSLQVTFPRAYFAPTESGEDQIVLLSDPIDEPADSSADNRLVLSTAPPLWQVLSIRLHWRTSSSPKEDALVASNAVLHWYVYGKTPNNHLGILHYVGTGSVSLSTDSTGAKVTINHAELKLADMHGEINDPFKSFRITSEFHADFNPVHVRQTMDDVDQALSQADHRDELPTTRP